MTPELKQDLDHLFAFASRQAEAIYETHGVEMGRMEIHLFDAETDCSECCGECENVTLPEVMEVGRASPVITSLEDFDAAVKSVADSFVDAISDAKDDFVADLELVGESAEQADLDQSTMSVLATHRLHQMQNDITTKVFE